MMLKSKSCAYTQYLYSMVNYGYNFEHIYVKLLHFHGTIYLKNIDISVEDKNATPHHPKLDTTHILLTEDEIIQGNRTTHNRIYYRSNFSMLVGISRKI